MLVGSDVNIAIKHSKHTSSRQDIQKNRLVHEKFGQAENNAGSSMFKI